MKNVYLILAIIGFIVPNIFAIQETLASGNILLWTDPLATMQGMFANRIASAFVADLLIVVMVFFVWSFYEAKKYQFKNLWVIWILTMLFGLSGTLPLFLYLIENKKE